MYVQPAGVAQGYEAAVEGAYLGLLPPLVRDEDLGRMLRADWLRGGIGGGAYILLLIVFVVLLFLEHSWGRLLRGHPPVLVL